MNFFGAAHGFGGPKKGPLTKISHTCPTIIELGTVISYLNKTQKIYLSRDTSLEFCWDLNSAEINIFLWKISKFCYIKNYRCRLHFRTQFLILSTFLKSLKIILINMVTILMISTKMANLGFFQIKLFWNKSYELIIYIHDVTIQWLTRYSFYFNADVVKWPMFGNSSISSREVIITSTL